MTRLETGRLILRPYREDDLDGFYACVSDPEVVCYEPYRPMSREEAGQTLASRLDHGEFWAMERKTDEFTSAISIWAAGSFSRWSWGMYWPASIGGRATPGKAVRL